MRADDPRVLAVAAAIVVLVDALASASPTGTDDELVPFPFGLERRAARALVRAGRLPSVRIGRRLFTRRSALLALVAPSTSTPASAVDSASEAARAAYARGSGLRVVRTAGRRP
jgi:hypothetical protein